MSWSQSQSRVSPTRDPADITKKNPAIDSTRKLKSSKGKGRSSPPVPKDLDSDWGGADPWSGTTSNREDVTHTAGSSKSFSKRYKFDDQDVVARQADLMRHTSIQDRPDNPSDNSGHESNPRDINIDETSPANNMMKLRISILSEMSHLITKSLSHHNSNGATPIKGAHFLRHTKSLPSLSWLKRDKQPIEDKPSLLHYTLGSRSRCISFLSRRFDQEAQPHYNQATRTAIGNSHDSRGGGSVPDVQPKHDLTLRKQWDTRQTLASDPTLQSQWTTQQTTLVSERLGMDPPGEQLLDSESQLVDTMVALLRNPSTSSDASLYLSDLTKFDNVRSTFISKGIVPKITALLSNPDSIICVSAIHVLETLVDHGNFEKRLRNDIVPRVIALLCGLRIEMEVRQRALNLLRSLAYYADTRRLLGNQGLPVFVLLVDHPQSDVAKVSRSALRILAIYDDTRVILNKIAIPKLISLLGSLRLTSESRIHECQLIAMGIMEDLAVYPDTRDILNSQVLPKLVSLLNHPKSYIFQAATEVLGFLSQFADSRHSMIHNDEATTKLISLLLDPSRSHVHWRVVGLIEQLVNDILDPIEDMPKFCNNIVPKLVSVFDHSNSTIRRTALSILKILARDDVARSILGDLVISKLVTLLDHPRSDVIWTSMNAVEFLVEYGDTRSGLHNEVIPKLISLLDHSERDVYLSAITILEIFPQYDDIKTKLLSNDVLSKVSGLLEATGDSLEMVSSFLSNMAGGDDTRAVYEEDIIPKVVALLGSNSETIHDQAVDILSDIIDESTTLSEEIILQIVKPLNNPSEDISHTTTLLLYALAQKSDDTLNSLLRPPVVHEMIGFIGRNFSHVQCCVIKIMALFVDEESIRTTLLDANIFPTLANLLTNTTISPRMFHALLWSIEQFLLYDELRNPIIRSDMMYALVQLQSTEKLQDDYRLLLSNLMADGQDGSIMRLEYFSSLIRLRPLENVSVSFHSASGDTSQSPVVFQCLIGAQEAADRVVSETNTLKALLGSYQITPQDYFVQAGFNEDLLARGTGHLQEIYIYLSKEVETQNLPSVIDDVGKLFHPFPCVLLAAENSYRTPPPPELPLGFDSIILEQADRQHQIMRLTNHLDELGSSEPMSNGESALQDEADGRGGSGRQSGGLGGDGSGNRDDNNNTSPNRRSKGSGGEDDGESGNPPNDRDDNEPEGKDVGSNGVAAKQATRIPEVVCNSYFQVYLQKVASSSKLSSTESPPKQDTLFQEFTMRVVVAIDAQPSSGPDPPSVSLQCKHLGFYTDPVTLEHPYEHRKVQVKIDSTDTNVHPYSFHPHKTNAAGSTITQTDGRQLTGGLNFTIGMPGTVSGGGNVSRVVSHTRETIRNLSRITTFAGETYVRWSYDVDDFYQQQDGLELEPERSPFLKFWLRTGQVDKPLRVEVSGYWVTPFTPKKGVKFAVFSAFRKRHAVPLLRNFCHSTCIILPSDLPRSAVSTLRLKACMPCSLEDKLVIESPEKDSELGVVMDGQVELGD